MDERNAREWMLRNQFKQMPDHDLLVELNVKTCQQEQHLRELNGTVKDHARELARINKETARARGGCEQKFKTLFNLVGTDGGSINKKLIGLVASSFSALGATIYLLLEAIKCLR